MVTAYALVVPGLALVVPVDAALSLAVLVAPPLPAGHAHHLVATVSAARWCPE